MPPDLHNALMGEDPNQTLGALEQQAEDRLAQISAEIEPLERERRLWQERLRVLKEARHLYSRAEAKSVASDTDVVGAASLDAPAAPAARGSVRSQVLNHVRTLLADFGNPMNINDIHREFLSRGWDVPGAGRPANISAHLTNADGIYSPMRGVYALGSKPAKRQANKTGKAPRRRTTP